MSVDAQGFLWLADPMTAAATLVGLTALLLWRHRRLAADAEPARVPVPARTDDALARRQNHADAHRWPAA